MAAESSPSLTAPTSDEAEGQELLLVQIDEVRANLAELERRYAQSLLRPLPSAGGDRRPRRIFVDGAFDLMHFGHMNAFRQARALGDMLVVGVNSSSSVAECKGSPPVLTDEERQQAVAACRFVDEIVPASPYVMTAEYIHMLMDEKNIDCFVHGDDPCLVDGKDVYEAAKAAGRYRSIARTEGISTTDILGRVLTLSKEHHQDSAAEEAPASPTVAGGATFGRGVYACNKSTFLVTSHLMQAFKGSSKVPAEGQSIVYIDGAWDMFHAGHVAILRRARELGDYLLVGVHSDMDVNRSAGSNYPIMAMQERVLSVLGCRYVDDVLLDPPWHVTHEMIKTLQISKVIRGTTCDYRGEDDPHAVPKALGIHVELESQVALTVNVIVERLQHRRQEAEARFREKSCKEQAWFNRKHGLGTSATTPADCGGA